MFTDYIKKLAEIGDENKSKGLMYLALATGDSSTEAQKVTLPEGKATAFKI